MKQLTVNFTTRVKLIGILQGARAEDGGYDKLHAMLHIFQQIRFSDAELEEISIVPMGSAASYVIKDPARVGATFALKTFLVEDAEAAHLRKELSKYLPQATFPDLEWMEPLKEQLEAKPKMPSTQMTKDVQ